MALVEYELIINAPQTAVYAASQDYSVRYQWDPFPEKIELLGGATEVGIGVKTLVVAKSGLTMEVEFVQVAPPTTAAIVMTKGPAFIKSFGGSWVFKPISANSTKAKFRYSIKTKKWAIPIISEYVASLYFKRAVKARLAGLKKYCEQGA
ncbi:SRPBCC family protein [Pseudomonas chengduensis]|nr:MULTISPECIES: SRPBCC family protein [Pseudomonas]ATH83071.1 polyketide cyclase/dehydrase [Pseudomonas mendocina]MDH1538518.1 SRPBCC family protein [Pseudomonas chengduensis]UTH37933.1 SRPBCC family protein [Pseudomonas sp. KHPS1]